MPHAIGFAEVDIADIQDLLSSHGETLTNEEQLQELTEQQAVNNSEIEEGFPQRG